MTDVIVGTVIKKRNSTLQGVVDNTLPCRLKDSTAEDSPTFLFSINEFPFNYVKWGSNYYFVDSVTYVRNNLIEVSCTLDYLATYKQDILNTTAFVSYSNVSGGQWLIDSRIPISSQVEVLTQSSTSTGPFEEGGHYMLTVLGKTGCNVYSVTIDQISDLISDIQDSLSDIETDLLEYTDMELLAKTALQTDLLGNAFANAPQCIKSCKWVPFSEFNLGSVSDTIYLGNLATKVQAFKQRIVPRLVTSILTIPWKYSDWRRQVCEDISLYLPFVGIVSLPMTSIILYDRITIEASFTMADGSLTYMIYAGSASVEGRAGTPIGIYHANCAIDYPIGINQASSVGDIATSVVNGIDKTVSIAINSTSAAGAAAGAVLGLATTAYDVADTVFTTKPSFIGGSGGSGAGFDLHYRIINNVHPTLIEPSSIQSTLGVPTMQVLPLSSCSGYCKTANAHVAAPAHASVLADIDNTINTGFYIE